MNKVALIVLVSLIVAAFATSKVVVEKILLKPDTTITIDTICTVTQDTLKLVKTLKDSSFVVRTDSVTLKSKPVLLKK